MGPGASGCHSAVQSNYLKTSFYRSRDYLRHCCRLAKPVKDGYENILKGVKEIDKAMAENPKLSVEKNLVLLLWQIKQGLLQKNCKKMVLGVCMVLFTPKNSR